MPPGFPDPAALHPMRFPGGRVNLGLVHLARAIDHPNIAVGDFTYASAFDPPGVARLLALAWGTGLPRISRGRRRRWRGVTWRR